MRQVIARPATLLMTTPEGVETHLYIEAALTEDEVPEPGQIIFLNKGGNEAKLLNVTDVVMNDYGRLEATTQPNGYAVVVRTTEPADGVALPWGIPLPVPVIGSLLLGSSLDVELQAAYEDDNMVVTLLLLTDTGIYARYSNQWIAINDLDVIDGLNVRTVEPASVDIFDQADQAGNQLPLGAFPDGGLVTESPSAAQVYIADNVDRAWTPAPPTPVTPAPSNEPAGPVMTGGAHGVVSVLADLPNAIELAKHDPNIRWYVERRARALDPNYRLPWDEDE